MSIENIIRERLEKTFNPVHITIVDESHLHIGHRGNTGGGHFQVMVVSDYFTNMSRLNRQRAIKDCLQDLFPKQIHALSIKALTPSEKVD